MKAAQKIASGVGGGPNLANEDLFGRSFTSMGDLDGDRVADLAVGTERDDTGGTNRGAVHMLFLSSTIPGDFDLDGVVESDDLPLWKANFGTTGGPSVTTGDADDDRDVDGRDFLIWQQSLGMSIGSTVTAEAAVAATSPENIAMNRNAMAAVVPQAAWQIDVGRNIGLGFRSRYATPLDYEAFFWRIANHRTTAHQAAHFGDVVKDRRLFEHRNSAQTPEEELDTAIAMDVALADLFAT